MRATIEERNDPIAVPEDRDRPIIEPNHPPPAFGNLIDPTDGHRSPHNPCSRDQSGFLSERNPSELLIRRLSGYRGNESIPSSEVPCS